MVGFTVNSFRPSTALPDPARAGSATLEELTQSASPERTQTQTQAPAPAPAQTQTQTQTRSRTLAQAQGKKFQTQQRLPAGSAATLTRARELAGNAAQLRSYIDSLTPSTRGPEVRRLLQAAANDTTPGNRTASQLLGQLQALGINNTDFQSALQSYQNSRKDRLAHRGELPPEAERVARRTISPPTREIQAGEAASTEVVPQNTSAMVRPSDTSVRQLVTKGVYDCVVVTYWDPVTKAGGLAHIPAGSNGDLSGLNEELKRQGLPANRLQFSILGGVDYATSMASDSGQLVPSALWKIQSLQRQLSNMGVRKSSVALHTLHTQAEVTTGNKSNIGINLDTGRTFFFSDPQRVLPDAQDRGYAELQDSSTDLYIVNRAG